MWQWASSSHSSQPFVFCMEYKHKTMSRSVSSAQILPRERVKCIVSDIVSFILFKTGYITSNMRELFYIYVGSWCALVSVYFICRVFEQRPVQFSLPGVFLYYLIRELFLILIFRYYIILSPQLLILSAFMPVMSLSELFTLLHLFAFVSNVYISTSLLFRPNDWIT